MVLLLAASSKVDVGHHVQETLQPDPSPHLLFDLPAHSFLNGLAELEKSIREGPPLLLGGLFLRTRSRLLL
jgi:hypothetical protein